MPRCMWLTGQQPVMPQRPWTHASYNRGKQAHLFFSERMSSRERPAELKLPRSA